MKFTHEKPTVPGDYLLQYDGKESFAKVYMQCGTVRASGTFGDLPVVYLHNAFWSERLVPVGEVDAAKAETEKVRAELQARVERMRGEVEKAYHEGALAAAPFWINSRARRVVEGKEKE